MANTVQTHLTVLWEHEIREAAAALVEFRAAYDAPEDTTESRARCTALAAQALACCGRALAGVEPNGTLVMTSLPTPKRRKGAK